MSKKNTDQDVNLLFKVIIHEKKDYFLTSSKRSLSFVDKRSFQISSHRFSLHSTDNNFVQF